MMSDSDLTAMKTVVSRKDRKNKRSNTAQIEVIDICEEDSSSEVVEIKDDVKSNSFSRFPNSNYTKVAEIIMNILEKFLSQEGLFDGLENNCCLSKSSKFSANLVSPGMSRIIDLCEQPATGNDFGRIRNRENLKRNYEYSCPVNITRLPSNVVPSGISGIVDLCEEPTSNDFGQISINVKSHQNDYSRLAKKTGQSLDLFPPGISSFVDLSKESKTRNGIRKTKNREQSLRKDKSGRGQPGISGFVDLCEEPTAVRIQNHEKSFENDFQSSLNYVGDDPTACNVIRKIGLQNTEKSFRSYARSFCGKRAIPYSNLVHPGIPDEPDLRGGPTTSNNIGKIQDHKTSLRTESFCCGSKQKNTSKLISPGVSCVVDLCKEPKARYVLGKILSPEDFPRNDDYSCLAKRQRLSSSSVSSDLRVVSDHSFALNTSSHLFHNFYNPYETSCWRMRGLRPVIIDGNNVAVCDKGIFHSKRIKTCVDFFLRRGHRIVKAFVPQYRLNVMNHYFLRRMELAGTVAVTPSPLAQGGRTTFDINRFIVQYTTEVGGVVVTNDNYRDLWQENPRWRDTIQRRLLMFTWVGDFIMFPLDPLGRRGPHLNEFLRFRE